MVGARRSLPFGLCISCSKGSKDSVGKKTGKHQLIRSQLDYGSYPKFGLLGGKTSSIPNQWSGQIIATSADVTLNGGLIRELPQNPLIIQV